MRFRFPNRPVQFSRTMGLVFIAMAVAIPTASCNGGHPDPNSFDFVNSRGDPWELQLKGAGITAYSRDGDGRAVLRSTVREYLCSEAMHGLGIPTTRALCIIASGEEVYREQIESGAILVRMAPSHLRFGSFELFYYRGEFSRL